MALTYSQVEDLAQRTIAEVVYTAFGHNGNPAVFEAAEQEASLNGTGPSTISLLNAAVAAGRLKRGEDILRLLQTATAGAIRSTQIAQAHHG